MLVWRLDSDVSAINAADYWRKHRKLSCGIVRCNPKDYFYTAHELAYMIFTGLRIIGRIARWFCQANQIVPESYVMMTEVLLNHKWWFFQQSQNHSWNHNIWNRECLESSPGDSLLLWNRLWNHNLVPKRELWIREWKIGRRTVINRTRIRNEVETKTNMQVACVQTSPISFVARLHTGKCEKCRKKLTLTD